MIQIGPAKGIDEVLDQLRKLRLDALRPTLRDLLNDIAYDAADYPPELPNQRYQRTGDLGRGWTDGEPMFSMSGNSLMGELVNSVSYAAEVMGPGEQEAIFVDRWRTTDQIVDAWEARVANAVQDAIDQVIPA